MSFISIRPVTVEQRREREQRQRDLEREQTQRETDLIIAELLEKISRLEANEND